MLSGQSVPAVAHTTGWRSAFAVLLLRPRLDWRCSRKDWHGAFGPDQYGAGERRGVGEPCGARRLGDRTAVGREVAHGCCATGWSTTCRGPSWAAGSGVSQPYVAKLERGDQAPSLATLARLAQRLGLEFPIAITPTTVRLSP